MAGHRGGNGHEHRQSPGLRRRRGVAAVGGINTKLKLAKPNVYETDYQLGRPHLHVVADLSVTPRMLNVTEKNLGCKWTAKKE